MLPLKFRLRAWWDGYDPDDISRRLCERRAEVAVETLAAAELPPDPPLPATQRPANETAAPLPSWDDARLAAAQLVWGDGHLGPTGEAQLRELAVEFELGSSSSIMHLGAELGGTALVLRNGIGARVLPADTVSDLVERSKGRVTQITADDSALANDVDLILVDHLAERGDRLARLLRAQSAGLARGGKLVIRTLVIADPAAMTSESYREWIEFEPVRPRLRNADEVSRLVQEAGLVVKRTRNETGRYVEAIEVAWGAAIDMVRLLPRNRNGRQAGERLLDEGERWLRRTELLESGTVAYREIVAARRGQ